jgi:hypothetical protein
VPALIVFVHIPKTAGSSFRLAAERQFGPEALLFDYGPEAAQTSSLVKHWIYERQDSEGFRRAVDGGSFRFLSGHFNRDKYADLPGARFVTWLRDPVDRLWSSFRHWRRHQGFEGEFTEFLEQPRRQNQQARILGGRLEGLSFVGLTERYASDLALFNAAFGTDFWMLRANEAPPGDSERPSDEEVAYARALNDRDQALYEAALAARSPVR